MKLRLIALNSCNILVSTINDSVETQNILPRTLASFYNNMQKFVMLIYHNESSDIFPVRTFNYKNNSSDIFEESG
ncbi:hypothetical protein Anas_13415 [Armadillidium nasatum]|uniref:Uncharacterized protein n=1 Tax=Armadillidium nasatum TaxID=96803 RepID=A0A5N5T0F2_9CRUS|nr:hypothetical protein Anas_13415 [Armadillidium nasatum]